MTIYKLLVLRIVTLHYFNYCILQYISICCGTGPFLIAGGSIAFRVLDYTKNFSYFVFHLYCYPKQGYFDTLDD